jgi:hypothetical protein
MTIDDHIANSHLPNNSNLQSQSIASEKLSLFAKRILIVDDDPDITLTFKNGLEAELD